MDIEGDHVAIFPGCAPAILIAEQVSDTPSQDEIEHALSSFFLDDLDARGDGASRTLDITKLPEMELSPGALFRGARRGVQASLRHALVAEPGEVSELIPRDLDGDGRGDVIVVAETKGEWLIQVLVRRD